MSDAFPGDPRWLPASETELQRAIDEGLLEESHYLDVKRELSSGKSANKELARDLASFAIDGGMLVVGVEENQNTGTLTLCPQPLAGLSERVEQVARDVPDPPVDVVTHEIRSESDDAAGYLVVVVGRSATAPHMVDNRYMGRGDKTKTTLSDAEVVRLHDRGRLSRDDALRLLERQIERDPVPAEARRQSHLFLLAHPSAGRPEMLLDLTGGTNWHQQLLDLVNAGYAPDVVAAVGPEQFSPDLRMATNPTRRAAGAALSTYNLTAGRQLDDSGDRFHEDFVEVEVDEDGGIRVLMTRFSDTLQSQEDVVFDVAAAIYARRFLAMVAAASQRSGYFGQWLLAVGATRLRGLRSYEMHRDWNMGPRYDEDEYRNSTVASYSDLTNRPGALADRLVGRLLRSFGTHAKWASMLQD